MDAQQFDRLTRYLAGRLPRRRLATVFAMVAPWLIAAPLPGAEAKKKRRKRQNKKKKKCRKGKSKCGKKCVNTKTNALHCGGCGRRCGANVACVGGVCQGGGCSGEQILCDALCVDPNDNDDHCGGCDNACAEGESCVEGACLAPACNADERYCDSIGRCIPADDPDRCCVESDCGGAYANPYGSLACDGEGFCVCKHANEGRCTNRPAPIQNFQCDVCCGDGEGCPFGQVCNTQENNLFCECDRASGFQECPGGCTQILGSDVFNCGACGSRCCGSIETCEAEQRVCRAGVCCTEQGGSCIGTGLSDNCCSRFCREGQCSSCGSSGECLQSGTVCNGGRCCKPSGAECHVSGKGFDCCSGACAMHQDGFSYCD